MTCQTPNAAVCVCVLQWLSWRGSLHTRCVHLRATVPCDWFVDRSAKCGRLLLLLMMMIMMLLLWVLLATILSTVFPTDTCHTPETSAPACPGTTGRLVWDMIANLLAKWVKAQGQGVFLRFQGVFLRFHVIWEISRNTGTDWKSGLGALFS